MSVVTALRARGVRGRGAVDGDAQEDPRSRRSSRACPRPPRRDRLLLIGCTGSAQDAASLAEDVRDAVEQAEDQAAAQGDVGQQAPAAPARPMRTDTDTAFDHVHCTGTLEQVIAALEEYWSRALPEVFGVECSSPSRSVSYRPGEQSGPSCGGEQATSSPGTRRAW